MRDVRATVIWKLTYCAPSWSLVLVLLQTVPSWNHLSTDAKDLATAVTTIRHTVNLLISDADETFSSALSPTMDTFYNQCLQTVLLSHTVCGKEHRMRRWSLKLLTLVMLECCQKSYIEHFINIYFLLNHLSELRVTTNYVTWCVMYTHVETIHRHDKDMVGTSCRRSNDGRPSSFKGQYPLCVIHHYAHQSVCRRTLDWSRA